MAARWIAAALACTLAPCASAELRFSRDVDAALRTAREQQRPLLCYLTQRPGVSSAERLREQRTLRHRAVESLGRMFVCVELEPGRHPDLVDAWRLSPRVDRYVVFAAPDRQRLHGARIGDPAEFIDDLREARAAFGQFLWETQLRAVVARERPAPGPLRDALERIVRFQVRAADAELVRLVRRDDLPAALRPLAWQALAKLSTRPAIATLADHARFDEHARAALAHCTPIAAEYLVEWLGHGPADRDAAIYAALCEVAQVRPRRKPVFWAQPDRDEVRHEISWIRRRITERAMASYLEPEE